MDYRDRIAKLFKDSKVSLNEFQVKNGFTAGHLSRVLRKEGNNHLTMQELMAVCKEFSVTADHVLFGSRNDLSEVQGLKERIRIYELKLESANELLKELDKLNATVKDVRHKIK